jgi:hypothetical protein
MVLPGIVRVVSGWAKKEQHLAFGESIFVSGAHILVYSVI